MSQQLMVRIEDHTCDVREAIVRESRQSVYTTYIFIFSIQYPIRPSKSVAPRSFTARQTVHFSDNLSALGIILRYTRVYLLNIYIYIHLTNRFHVAVRLFRNRSQMTKCVVRTKVAHEAQPSVTDVLTTF